MTLFVVERVPAGLRGRLTRWMLEVHPGVFVGTLSSRVADELWQAVTSARGDKGACTYLRSSGGEQRFTLRTAGTPSRQPADYDGLVLLVRRLSPELKEPRHRSLKTGKNKRNT